MTIIVLGGKYMKTMNITDFKAHALRVINKIAVMHENVIITKRGKALVEVIPFKPHKTEIKPGRLASALVLEKDIVSPPENDWEANR
jgi:antitoxin (DNA-binding transcriptional repressor) of toxin-antitoxin stability system